MHTNPVHLNLHWHVAPSSRAAKHMDEQVSLEAGAGCDQWGLIQNAPAFRDAGASTHAFPRTTWEREKHITPPGL